MQKRQLRSNPSAGTTLLDQPFPAPDYEDEFLLRAAQPVADIADFTSRLALRQPRWLTGVSMAITKRDELAAAVNAVNGGAGDRIGNWRVVDRSDASITFAEDMRIMRYRISYSIAGGDEVVARTEVEQASRMLGPVYWALATPLHRRFLSLMLRNAGGPGSTTTQTR